MAAFDIFSIHNNSNTNSMVVENGLVMLNTVDVNVNNSGSALKFNGGTLYATASSVVNIDGGAVDVSNSDANTTSPNMFAQVICSGDIICGNTPTIVEGVYGDNITGNALIYRSAERISNTSDVDGQTVNDALNNLKTLTEASIGWNEINDKPEEFTPEDHTHTESEITNLDKYTQSEVDSKLDNLQHLDTPVTKILFVDKNRNDNYNETGSMTNPFKTINDAINISDNGTLINVAFGEYTEDVVLPSGVSLHGMAGGDRPRIMGDLIAESGRPSSISQMYVSGEGKKLEIKNSCSLYNIYIGSRLELSGRANARFWNTSIRPDSDVVPVTMNTERNAYMSLCDIETGGSNKPTISLKDGHLFISETFVVGKNSDGVITSTGGNLSLHNTDVLNIAGGKAVDLSGTDTGTIFNKIINCGATGDFVCGDAATVVDGIYFNTDNSLSGTNLFYKQDKYIGNTSNVEGETVRDALDKLLEMEFTPSNNDDWNTTPSNVAEALNELASRLKALETS